MKHASYLTIVTLLLILPLNANDFFDMAPSRSLQRKKPVMYLISTSWSGTYKQMVEEVFNLPLIYEYMAHFDVVEVDGDNAEVQKRLPEAFRTNLYPAIAIYSPNGLLGTSVGIQKARDFFDFLHYAFRRFRYDYYSHKKEWLPHPMIAPWDEESRTEEQLENQSGYLLRTGRVITGTPMMVEDGYVLFTESGIKHRIQAALFTPQSRELVMKKALETMQLKSSLVAGPEGEEFEFLSGLSDINAKKGILKDPFLVLLDPSDEFHFAIELHANQNLKDKNALTYIKKFRVGSNLDADGVAKIANFYKVETPALLIVGPGVPIQKFSNLKSVSEFFSYWKPKEETKLSKKE